MRPSSGTDGIFVGAIYESVRRNVVVGDGKRNSPSYFLARLQNLVDKVGVAAAESGLGVTTGAACKGAAVGVFELEAAGYYVDSGRCVVGQRDIDGHVVVSAAIKFQVAIPRSTIDDEIEAGLCD